MKHSLVVTLPDFDLTTQYISAWAEKVIGFAKENKSKVFLLASDKASRKEFTNVLQKENPSLVFINGHGNYNLVCGQDNEILLKAKDNEEALKGKTAYALSCRSGKVLGPSCAKAGACGYIGYNEDFIFLYDENSQKKPQQDKVALMFAEPSNEVMISLLNNNTAKEAHNNSQQSFSGSIKKLLSSKATPLQNQIVKYLLWDKQHQVCCAKP